MFVDVKKLLAICPILFAFPACGGDPPAPSTLEEKQTVASAPGAVLAPGTMQGGGAGRGPAPGSGEDADRAEQARMIAWEQSFSIEMRRRHEEHLAQPGRGSEQSGERIDEEAGAPPAQAQGYVAPGAH